MNASQWGFDNLPLPDESHHADVPMLPGAAAEESRRLLLAQIATLENRSGALQRQLMIEQDGRRADNERLLREIGSLQSELAEVKTLWKLYRNRGRIDGDSG